MSWTFYFKGLLTEKKRKGLIIRGVFQVLEAHKNQEVNQLEPNTNQTPSLLNDRPLETS